MERLLSGIGFETAQWTLLAVLLVGAVVLLAGALRRSVIERRGGAVECYLRAPGARGRRGVWRIGFGRYGSESLGWFPIFSLRPRPTATLSRRGLVIVGRRSPTPEDRDRLPADVSVVSLGWLTAEGEDPTEAAFELAMGEMAMTGFLSWLESMPPGTHWEA
ncbi:DUF2550 domain-containing protein [Nocardiopsis sp. HNM0947]|uniref:DUF2550 domain-containing protein n=1 Tax=Nocardiopsis coralli TaxID=2772213 RepID=A0ABR9PCE1_9ACTN|nr:DUF2550 domain-containing protein [Nocardiopsis coralli]MBE3001504.1 DUF2550 domain-containing protein [Nocardiopsis coralli]